MVIFDTVKKIAEAEIGYLEKASNSQLDSQKGNAGSANYTKYWRDLCSSMQGQPWCNAFVNWCFVKAYGESTAKSLLCTSGGWSYYTPTSAQYFKNKGQWYTSPKTGDIIYFKNSTRICHVGIVYKVTSSTVYTIEGNTSGGEEVIANGGAVCAKSYSLSNSRIAGYGRPKYDSTTTSSNSTSSSSASYLTSSTVLKKGLTGTEVKQLQEDLIYLGYSCGASGADGDFGANTDSAVRSFQKANGLTVDGQVGNNTKAKITALKAAKKNSSTSSNSGTTSSSSSSYGKRISEYKTWLMKNYKDIIKKVCGFELSNSEAWGTNCEKATITVWKDVMNRKYGAKLTLGNYNFGSSCKACAITLKEGASGTLVALIQGILASEGYYGGTISANYDKTLTAAIKAFQKARKLTCDGICGVNTWYALFN